MSAGVSITDLTAYAAALRIVLVAGREPLSGHQSIDDSGEVVILSRNVRFSKKNIGRLTRNVERRAAEAAAGAV